ncbi:hypothetical protein Tco_0679172 [Tanacetum coccineum]|uniref:Uncharacterized protein n=1 Tax=Tanacetum coccineum TaxID=301880 RepID=A0ABQ4XI31_9ASTR
MQGSRRRDSKKLLKQPVTEQSRDYPITRVARNNSYLGQEERGGDNDRLDTPGEEQHRRNDKQRSGGKKDAPRRLGYTNYSGAFMHRKLSKKSVPKNFRIGMWHLFFPPFNCGTTQRWKPLTNRDKCKRESRHPPHYIDGGASADISVTNMLPKTAPLCKKVQLNLHDVV